MPDLYSLYKLHKIDEALVSLRQQAGSLDTGKEELEQVKLAVDDYKLIGERAKELTAELRDRELQQKGLEEKLEKLNKKLYDGSIVSPKEIENVKTEIESTKAFSEKNDERLLELYEEAPPVVKQAEEVETRLKEIEASAKAKKDEAVQRHAEIKAEFDRLRTERPDYTSQVDPELLEMYDDIRKHTGDVGMTVVTEGQTCDQCGNTIPDKTIELLNLDRLMTCEDCRRILFVVVPQA